MIGQASAVEPAELRESRIERRHVVPLGQKQIIALRIVPRLRADPQHTAVEMDEEIGARQRRADETATARRHADDVAADGESEGGEVMSDRQGILKSNCHNVSSIKRVSPAPTVRSSSRWWRYQLTPAQRALIARSSGRAASSARMSSSPKTGRSGRQSAA